MIGARVERAVGRRVRCGFRCEVGCFVVFVGTTVGLCVVGCLLGALDGVSVDDDLHEKELACKKTAESNLRSPTSVMAMVKTFRPSCGIPRAVSGLVKPSNGTAIVRKSLFTYSLQYVLLLLELYGFPQFTDLMETAVFVVPRVAMLFGFDKPLKNNANLKEVDEVKRTRALET